MQGKNIWQNSTSIHDLNSQQTRKKREPPQSDKEHLNKTPATNIIINDETLNASSQKIWRKASDALFNITLYVLASPVENSK